MYFGDKNDCAVVTPEKKDQQKKIYSCSVMRDLLLNHRNLVFLFTARHTSTYRIH